jgi:hypothetical protein
MKCKNCDTLLSLQDLEKNEWHDDSEVFYIKCSVCNYITTLNSNLFEQGHVSQQYLGLIIYDSGSQKEEKFINYIPEIQRKKLFEHLENCDECKKKIESIRLDEVLKQIRFNEKTYNFFVAKAKNVIKQLDHDKVKLKDGKITSFIFENEQFTLNQEDLFYQKKDVLNDIEINRLYYDIKKNNFHIGIVSFAISNDRIILEKIWLKSENLIEKEKEFLKNLRSGKFRILFDLITKLKV